MNAFSRRLNVIAVALSLWAVRAVAQPKPPATLIRDALVIDGRGTPGVRGDVRVMGDRITAVGQLTPQAGDRVIDARGRAIAPGFIDTHSHHDRGLFSARDAKAMVSQGITTIVVGQDGGGMNLRGLFTRLDTQPAAVNVASYAGHGSIRGAVLGAKYERRATAPELARMEQLLREEMQAGALGLSTGLEYDPGIYASEAEVLALAKVADAAGGRYISDMRSEDRDFWPALTEIITIGRVNRKPEQVSHIELGKPNFADSTETAFILEHLNTADDILFNRVDGLPDYRGRTLAQVAALRGRSPGRTMMELLAEPGGSGSGIIAKGMDDADVATLIRWPYTNVCSAGQSSGLHPRGFGSFPKVLGPYVRECKLFSTEESVRKMTSLRPPMWAVGSAGASRRGTRPGALRPGDRDRSRELRDATRAGHGHRVGVGDRGARVRRRGRTGRRAGKALRRSRLRPCSGPRARRPDDSAKMARDI